MRETEIAGNHVTVTHRDIRLHAGSLHYVEAGSGQPLVLIHGGFGCWLHWAANIAPLAAHRHVFALDLPGFGQSYDPGLCLEPSAQAAVVAEFIEAMSLPEATVIGFSFGTLVATTLALARADLIGAVVLVNPPGVGPRSPEALALPARMSELAREQGKRAGVEGTLRELMLCNHALISAQLIDAVSESIVRTRYVTRSISQQSETLAMLGRLTQPALVLLGAQDPFHSNDLPGRRAAIDALLGPGATQVIPQAAHWLQYDQAAQFNRVVLDFTDRAVA